MNHLESLVSQSFSESTRREISCIVDTTVHLARELKASADSLGLNIRIEKYSGPCAFFTAVDSDEFFTSQGLDGHRHPDGVYGWSMVLGNPDLKVSNLPGRHIAIFVNEEATVRIAETIISFYEANLICSRSANSSTYARESQRGDPYESKQDISPSHLSRDASSLAVPQEDSMCGDGPSVHKAAGEGALLMTVKSQGQVFTASAAHPCCSLISISAEAAQDGDAAVARCPDAPIESTAPL